MNCIRTCKLATFAYLRFNPFGCSQYTSIFKARLRLWAFGCSFWSQKNKLGNYHQYNTETQSNKTPFTNLSSPICSDVNFSPFVRNGIARLTEFISLVKPKKYLLSIILTLGFFYFNDPIAFSC